MDREDWIQQQDTWKLEPRYISYKGTVWHSMYPTD